LGFFGFLPTSKRIEINQSWEIQKEKKRKKEHTSLCVDILRKKILVVGDSEKRT
jgi:hypothetical protein